MDDTWLRRLSLALVPVGVAIAVLGFGFMGTIDGLLGTYILVAGVAIFVLVPDTGESGEIGDSSNQMNRLVILLLGIVGGIISLTYVIFT